MALSKYVKENIPANEKKEEYPKEVFIACFFAIPKQKNQDKTKTMLRNNHYASIIANSNSTLEVNAEVQSKVDLDALVALLKDNSTTGYITPKDKTSKSIREW